MSENKTSKRRRRKKVDEPEVQAFKLVYTALKPLTQQKRKSIVEAVQVMLKADDKIEGREEDEQQPATVN